MPLIQVKLIEGVFDADEKEAIIEKLTDAMVSVEGEAMRPVTWVTIEEVASGEWGIGGKALHTGDIVGMRSAAVAEASPSAWPRVLPGPRPASTLDPDVVSRPCRSLFCPSRVILSPTSCSSTIRSPG